MNKQYLKMTTTILQPSSIDFVRPLGGLEHFILPQWPAPGGALCDGRPNRRTHYDFSLCEKEGVEK